jgi:hypothetical protein
LVLCWARFDEMEWNPSELLLSFPDVWLAAEAKRLGALIPRSRFGVRHRHRQFVRYLRFFDWLMTDVVRPGPRLVALGSSLGCHREPSPIGSLVRRLRKRIREFARYEPVVKAAAEKAIGPPPARGRSPLAQMGHGDRVWDLVDTARRLYVRTGLRPRECSGS